MIIKLDLIEKILDKMNDLYNPSLKNIKKDAITFENSSLNNNVKRLRTLTDYEYLIINKLF